MKSICVITGVVFLCLWLVTIIRANVVSKENAKHEDETLDQNQEQKISGIKKQILLLQTSLAEVTRSFSTLEVVVKNPSMMSSIQDQDSLGDPGRIRRRREVDSSSTLPTSFPSSSRGQQITDWNRNQLGPYSYPLFSGQCFLCPAGVPGPRGPPGVQGIAGRDGRDGRDSHINPQAVETGPLNPVQSRGDGIGPPPLATTGQPNPVGSRGDGVVRPVGNTTSSYPGTIYIRWGNEVCPEGAQLIYAGTIGGAHFTHTGSGSNHLCMPEEPIYDEVETTAHADRALLYSSEYQTSAAPPRTQPMHDHTPTCAVCRAPSGRTTKLMIPARNVCPSAEWRLEYAGYLMSERYTHKKSEFICVDREMDPKAGTTGNQDGTLLYMTEGRCLAGGGLDCGPYINGYELTCAVCTM